MSRKYFSTPHIFVALLSALSAAGIAAAQSSPLGQGGAPVGSSENLWSYAALLIGSAVLAGAIVLWLRQKKSNAVPEFNFDERLSKRPAAKGGSSSPARLGTERRSRSRSTQHNKVWDNPDDLPLNSKAFQEKMKKLQFEQLPIHSFLKLDGACPFEQLQVSEDIALLSAIEQANEEYEEDTTVRELAVRILAAFKNRNSVDALSQIALYDLSSGLRSKAVNALAEFDHESVFEPILLACADPTREVRAAAARGLFRLSFDRAEAWKRLIAIDDAMRMRHAARAAIESGIAQKSFDRLLSSDTRAAYEAFALFGMLIRSGETKEIFDAISNDKDERIKLALLQVLKAVNDGRSLARLEELTCQNSFTGDVASLVNETLRAAVPIHA